MYILSFGIVATHPHPHRPEASHPSIAQLIAQLIAQAVTRRRSSLPSSSANPKPTRSGVAPADLLGRYRPQGTMSDEDLLYVLSLFAVEPTRWVERFEWRAMDARERGALAVLWRCWWGVGDPG